jgi:hypothetical protein
MYSTLAVMFQESGSSTPLRFAQDDNGKGGGALLVPFILGTHIPRIIVR